MKSENSYRSRLESIKLLEDGGEVEKAQLARFSLLESFAGLRDRFTSTEEDFECLKVYVEVLVTLLRCRTDALEEFRRMIPIVRVIRPLMRYLDEEEHKSLITSLTTQLGSCTVFLVSEQSRFDEKLACDYCVLSFSELGEWLMNDQLAEFGQRICNKVCEHLNECNLAILQCVLQCMAQICKNPQGKFLTEFINLVDYVAKKCPVSESSIKVASIFKNLVEAYFSEVQELPLSRILSIYSIALSVTKVEEDLVKMDEGLKALNSIHVASHATYAHLFFIAFKLLLQPVFTLILTKHVNILAKRIELPNIQNLLEQFRELCCIYRKSETQKDIYKENNMVIVPIAVSLCTLKLATQEYTKDSIGFLREIFVTEVIQARYVRHAVCCIVNVGDALNKAGRTKEATELLKLLCQEAWLRILFFCKRCSSENGDELKVDLNRLVTATYTSCALLMKILSEYDMKELSMVLKDYLRSWSKAQIVCDTIPNPKNLVEVWVKMQLKDKKEPGARDRTIYNLLSSSCLDISNKALRIITEEELQIYKDLKRSNPKLGCSAMQRILIEILYEEINSPTDPIGKSKNLIERTREFRGCGIELLVDCEKSTSKAILIMERKLNEVELYKEDKGEHDAIRHHLAETYYLRSLCRQEADPNSEGVMQDICNALKLWCGEQTCTIPGKDLNMLLCVYDLSVIKGNAQHLSGIYKTMLKYFNSKNEGLKDVLLLLWNSRRLSHSLCGSPVSSEFITTLSKDHESSDSVEFWKQCMENLEPNAVGFDQHLSILPTISSPGSFQQDHAIHINIDKVKQAAINLIDSAPLSIHSWFAAGDMYYHLSESMIEALSYADESYKLRSKLLGKTFIFDNTKVDTIFDDNGEVIEMKYSYKNFRMISAVAQTAWSPHKCSSDSEDFMITPWNVLQCFLESMLQMGNLVDDARTAQNTLIRGKAIARVQGLCIFEIRFCIALAKLYRKQRKWIMSEFQLNSALSIWNSIPSHISCVHCKAVLEVSVKQELADLYIHRFKNKRKILKDLDVADSFYKEVEMVLKDPIWENDISSPEKASERKTAFCDAIGIPFALQGSENNCLHCQPLEVKKSISLKKLIQLKLECFRRRLLFRLLTGKGKLHKARGQINDEQIVLLESISVLVSRCLFRESHFPVSTQFVATMINQNLTGLAFGAEHTSILYKICWHFLRCTSNKDMSKKSIIPTETIVRGLKIAFIRTRLVPQLHRKVARLLAVLYASDEALSRCNSPCVNQWAAFFHQASVGTYLNSRFIDRHQDHIHQDPVKVDKIEADLEASVVEFFRNLPNMAILCISMLEDDSNFLSNLLPHSPTSVWIVLSRLNSDNVPIFVMLPIASTFQDSAGFPINKDCPVRREWDCPWVGDTIMDRIAPIFKSILEEFHTTDPNQSVTNNIQLNQCLSELLSNIEEKWFGRWNQLLLGEWSDYKNIVCSLRDHLKSKYDINADVNILKVVLEGAGLNTPKEEFLSELILSNGFYVGTTNSYNDCIDKDSFRSISSVVSKTREQMKKKGSTSRSPVILVLDLDIHMLPWENLPILRNQDVSRMPSVISICSTIRKRCSYDAHDHMVFPTIDPRDAYYVLNPQGDLKQLEDNFAEWFKKQKFEGIVGTSPTQDKLSMILKSRDIFMYMGHGSGTDCISGDIVRNLDRCAAAMLIGCSSGSLRLNGSYPPHGVVLDYVAAASPVVVSNLWDITTSNATQITKTLLRSWMHSTDDKTTVGSTMGTARESCYLPHLQGASLICYGIQTRIKKRVRLNEVDAK